MEERDLHVEAPEGQITPTDLLVDREVVPTKGE